MRGARGPPRWVMRSIRRRGHEPRLRIGRGMRPRCWSTCPVTGCSAPVYDSVVDIGSWLSRSIRWGTARTAGSTSRPVSRVAEVPISGRLKAQGWVLGRCTRRTRISEDAPPRPPTTSPTGAARTLPHRAHRLDRYSGPPMPWQTATQTFTHQSASWIPPEPVQSLAMTVLTRSSGRLMGNR